MKLSLFWSSALMICLLFLATSITSASVIKDSNEYLPNEPDPSDVDIGSRTVFGSLRFCRPGKIYDNRGNCRDVY